MLGAAKELSGGIRNAPETPPPFLGRLAVGSLGVPWQHGDIRHLVRIVGPRQN